MNMLVNKIRKCKQICIFLYSIISFIMSVNCSLCYLSVFLFTSHCMLLCITRRQRCDTFGVTSNGNFLRIEKYVIPIPVTVFPFPFPSTAQTYSHSRGIPMGIPFPRGFPFPCTALVSTRHRHGNKSVSQVKQEFVRPRWPYDMRPSLRAEKYIRDAGP